MWYVLDLFTFTVIHGPFLSLERAMQSKTNATKLYPKGDLVVVKVDDPEAERITA